MKSWCSKCFHKQYIIVAPSLKEAIQLSGLKNKCRFYKAWETWEPSERSCGVYCVPPEGDLIPCCPIAPTIDSLWRWIYSEPLPINTDASSGIVASVPKQGTRLRRVLDRTAVQLVLCQHVMEMDEEELMDAFERATGEIPISKAGHEEDGEKWYSARSLPSLIEDRVCLKQWLDFLQEALERRLHVKNSN